MKKIIHIDKYNIRENIKNNKILPVITVIEQNKEKLFGKKASIMLDGKELVKIIYDPQNPLESGANVWIETDCEVIITE